MKKKIIDSKFIDNLCDEQKNTKAVTCVKTRSGGNLNPQSPDTSIVTTDAEKQMHSTDLEFNKTSGFESSLLGEFSINTPNLKGNIIDKYPILNNLSAENNDCIKETKALLSSNKVPGTPTLFLFSRKKRENVENNPLARKSKKSTNLVKYKNLYQEPTLKKPLSTYMLLDKYKLKEVKKSKVGKYTGYEVIQKHANIQATIDNKEDKALQDSFTHSESDALVEKLLLSTFGSNRCNELGCDEFKVYLNDVVKEIYDVKKEKIELQNTPIQTLFKCLLQYWISSNKNIEEIEMKSKSIDRQSNKYFSKDQTTSNLPIKSVNRATQFYGISDFIEGTLKQMKQENDKTISSTLTDSFIKERRIQELEKILKNTVYICGAVNKSREKDIKITKKLINNLDNISQQNINKVARDGDVFDNSDSSNEIPKIQDTINNLISELPIPADVAKEFLGAYLDLLYENENNIESNSSTEGSDACQPKCDVQAESVQKNISKSISTREIGDNKRRLTDPGQIFLKDILDKVTTLFSKKNETYNTKTITTNALIGWDGISFHPIKDELGNYETKPNNNNSVLVNVSEYNLEHISMTNDLDFLSEGSITMNMKDKTNKSGEKKTLNLSLNFTEGVPNVKINQENLLSDISKTNLFFTKRSISPCTILHTPFINISNEATDLKPYLSSSEESHPQNRINDFAINPFLTDSNVSSKAYIAKNRCDNMRTYKIHLDKDSTEPKIINEYDLQPCFILSLNKAFASKMKLKRLFKDNEVKNVSIKNIKRLSSIIKNKAELSIFENVPKVIDEEFILLLLENISILSKDLPTLHKDINNLYTKLLRKHEKLCTNRIQGLSLLGKIYKESSNIRNMLEKETQYEGTDCHATTDKRNYASDTNDVNMKINNTDKALSAEITKVISNKCIQLKGNQEIEMTDKFNLTDKNILMTRNGNATQTSFSSLSSEEDILKADTATSNQNWYRQYCMRDCAISTLIKCFLDSNDGCQNFRFKDNIEGTTRDRDLPNKKSKNERKQSSKVRQDLIREINLLSPSFKVSIQSQTEKKLRWLREKSKPNDNNVYQLILSKKSDVKRSCSMIKAVTDKSDDLKTIYRCTSYPSYCSG
ncbi:uncharacterized protein LOC135194137 [Vanessa tameamea]|uniref:Uncharacterized protein LOC135194137 n=1 Tax=Vanessa tameamea TaxID=334116 RepID=A0ABM4AUV3_VANTA